MPEAPVPSISVVTPTFNRSQVLLRAVESVRKQSLGAYEHIIVDDGSVDGTAEMIGHLGDSRIVVHRFDSHRGANHARNQGIALARAPIVTFLDSDDEYLPHRLQNVLGIFGREPECSFAISSFVSRRRSGREFASSNRDARVDGASLRRAVMNQSIFLAGSAISARVEALRAIGGFDVELKRLQDREVLLRLAHRGKAFLTSEADWIKHGSLDAISATTVGYVEAYGAMLARHPDLRDGTSYFVARHILKQFLKRHYAEARNSYRANRSSPVLNYNTAALLLGFVLGMMKRRRNQDEYRL